MPIVIAHRTIVYRLPAADMQRTRLTSGSGMMSGRITPSIATLRECVEYTPETGLFFWKHRPEDHFMSSRICKAWNARFAGAQTFVTKHDAGYLQGTVSDVRLFAHRVAWALHYDEWPSEQVGHLNGNRADNRIANLVDRERRLSMLAGRRNIVGKVAGVYRNEQTGRWIARISKGGATRYIGSYATFDEAAKARRAAEKEMGGYPENGEDQWPDM